MVVSNKRYVCLKRQAGCRNRGYQPDGYLLHLIEKQPESLFQPNRLEEWLDDNRAVVDAFGQDEPDNYE